ncbi:MAG: PAS domain S-box protein, partial [Bacteroidetes bacterium]|nr:PAS domain S-box protein [Bacteroidota bacterium]
MSDSASDPGRLAALRRYEILDTPAEPAFDRIADLAAHLLDTPMAGIHFVDDQCQWAKAQVGLDAQMLDLDVAFCAHALDMEEVLVVEDAAEDPRFRDNPLVTGDPGIRFYAGAALITPDGYALGRLCVIDTVPRPSGLGAKERETLRQLAGVVMDELAYRAQPRRREEMLESITDAFFAVDDDWRITYLNQQAEVLLDRSREALLGQDLWGAFPEAKELAFYDAYHRAMQTGEPAEFEAYFPPLQTWFEVKAFPMEQGGLAVYYNDVTARHEREEALKKSQMLLKTSQRIAHLGHWDWDVETGAVEWSDETFRLFGYEPGALDPTVEIYFEALPAPDRERVRALSRRAITAGRIRPEDGRIEHRIVRPDGTERIVELEAQILESDAAGRPTRVLGTVLDVTRRRERKEQLRLMSRAVEEATEAVIITGPALDAPGPRIEYVNPAFEQMTGYAAEEVIGQTPRILQGPATDRATLDDVRSCLEQGDAVPAKTALNYRKDGTPYWVEWNITPVRGPDGTVQHWVSVQRDVTEQRQRQDALRQERNLLARIFEASAAAISVVDTNGQITRANGRAEEVLGLDPVTVTGRMYDDPAWEIEAVDGGPFPDNELPFVRVMATGAPVYDVRHAIAWPDGQRRILSINGAPLQDQAGAVVGVVFAITDVTEQHERAETLQNERQRLALALTGGNLGMWDVNFNEGRNIVDERWAAMLGY